MAQDLRYLEGPVSQLMAKADVVQEVDEQNIFLGFCQRGALALTDPVWSVCRIQYSDTKVPRTMTVMWAEGVNQPRFKFSDYLILNYKFRNF